MSHILTINQIVRVDYSMAPKPVILVVDDEASNLQLVEALLTPQGYEVVVSNDGLDALEKIQNKKVTPDLILLDALMPKMNGFELARHLKGDEETSMVPIILISSLRRTEDRMQAMESGIDDFLSKPFDAPELWARVRSALKIKACHDHMRNCRKELELEVVKRTEALCIALKKIPETSLETIYRLTRAAEYRDEDTGAHIQRMSHYAAAVAEKLGFNDDHVEHILHAAPMHDVGKIGIPDEILLKHGKLTSEEWDVMKQHTIIGSRILEGSQADIIKLAEVIALTHHEKWDGSGYPKGLKGKQIPVEGHIAAIADVFDILTSKRPYKEPYSVEKSLTIIAESRGTHFDPHIVDAFFSIWEQILAIKEEYRDNDESHLLRNTAIFRKQKNTALEKP